MMNSRIHIYQQFNHAEYLGSLTDWLISKCIAKKHFGAQSRNTKATVILLQGSRKKNICFNW